jgi:hypothetical protein
MSREKFIAPKHDMSKHPSMRCHRTRFEAAKAQETEFEIDSPIYHDPLPEGYSGFDLARDVYVAPKPPKKPQ